MIINQLPIVLLLSLFSLIVFATVPERCVSVNFLMTTTSDSLYTAAEFAVGKYPNLIPTFDNLQWTSYNSYVQNFTIDAWDPAFDGGNNCGLNHNRVCELYIGVVGYCVNSTLFNTVDFTFNISLTKESGIFRNTVPYQTIAPGQQNSYKMCVDTNASSFVYLSTNRDACGCSTNYTNLQMTVSKTQEKPELTDYVWQLADVFSTHSLPLLSTDDSVRPGSCECKVAFLLVVTIIIVINLSTCIYIYLLVCINLLHFLTF